MSKYRKAIAATIAGAVGWATAVVQSAPAHITATEWIMAATAAGTLVLVWLFPNDPA